MCVCVFPKAGRTEVFFWGGRSLGLDHYFKLLVN